jgi:hypothetical protein
MAPGVPPKASRSIGEWLSLVEHLVRDQGVGGSNPLSPTILKPMVDRCLAHLVDLFSISIIQPIVPIFVPTGVLNTGSFAVEFACAFSC